MADAITKFAGSMLFVYIHIVIFAVWMVMVEVDPWPKLTLVVLLEAIFLSTLVMIGQNRQAEFTQRKADHDFLEQETELHLNTDLTKTSHRLTQEIHAHVVKPPRVIREPPGSNSRRRQPSASRRPRLGARRETRRI